MIILVLGLTHWVDLTQSVGLNLCLDTPTSSSKCELVSIESLETKCRDHRDG